MECDIWLHSGRIKLLFQLLYPEAEKALLVRGAANRSDPSNQLAFADKRPLSFQRSAYLPFVPVLICSEQYFVRQLLQVSGESCVKALQGEGL